MRILEENTIGACSIENVKMVIAQQPHPGENCQGRARASSSHPLQQQQVEGGDQHLAVRGAPRLLVNEFGDAVDQQ